jgi:hypothetical protein
VRTAYQAQAASRALARLEVVPGGAGWATGWARAVGGKDRCRVGREVTHPGPSPDPDKEISTIRLFRRCDSWLHTPDPDRDPWAGERELSEEIREPFPIQPLALTATTQPLIPGPLCCLDEPQQATKVAAHAEVVEGSRNFAKEPSCGRLVQIQAEMGVI